MRSYASVLNGAQRRSRRSCSASPTRPPVTPATSIGAAPAIGVEVSDTVFAAVGSAADFSASAGGGGGCWGGGALVAHCVANNTAIADTTSRPILPRLMAFLLLLACGYQFDTAPGGLAVRR